MVDVYGALLDWIQGRPMWERDAWRRLVLTRKVGDAEIPELVELAKEESGLFAGSSVSPLPLASEHLNRAQSARESVILLGMRDLTNVNALAENQELEFAERGLTLIYGENGTGKTGYARILKAACRARTASEVLPNVRDHVSEAAAATFNLKQGQREPESVRWQTGTSSPDALATFSVFDRDCEHSFIDEEGELSYLPEGLGLFQEMASLANRVRAALANEQSRIAPTDLLDDLKHAVRLPDATKALLGNIRQGLRAEDYSRTLVALDEQCAKEGDDKRLADKQAQLADVKANDPAKKAQMIRRYADSIEAAAVAWSSQLGALESTQVEQLHDAATRLLSAESVVKEISARDAALASETPGLGSDLWRDLYQAAARYATTYVHQGHEFPDASDGATCPLCRQVLDASASERLASFKAFMTGEAEQLRRKAAQAVEEARVRILDVKPGALDENSLEQLMDRSPGAAAGARLLPSQITARRDAIVSALGTGIWEPIPLVTDGAIAIMGGVVTAMRQEASKLEVLADPKARATLESECEALSTAQLMLRNKARITKTVTRLRDVAALGECRDRITTHAITAKGKELAEAAASAGLTSAFNEEMRALGAAERMRITVGHRGNRGRALFRLQFDGSSNDGVRRSLILSEGEQRVVALAYFLAEARLSPAPVGIIIDDPVSSLDHRWCHAIAERLIELASDRQVIVFSHSISFYIDLETIAAEKQVPFTPRFVVQRGGTPGYLDPMSSPWDRLGVRERLVALKEEVKSLKVLEQDEPGSRGYRNSVNAVVNQLRSAWERAVEELVLNKVVERFGNAVKTMSMRGVACDDDTFKSVYDAMTRLSSEVNAHDRAAGHIGTMISVAQLESEIGVLELFLSTQRKKKNEVEAKRKELEKAPSASPAQVSPVVRNLSSGVK